jgi:hypothetical protein
VTPVTDAFCFRLWHISDSAGQTADCMVQVKFPNTTWQLVMNVNSFTVYRLKVILERKCVVF